MNTMPDELTITNPADRTYTVYRINNAKIAYDAALSVPHTAYLAAIGYAIEMLATDEDDEIEAPWVYRDCAMSCGELCVNNFEGYPFEDDGVDYLINAVAFIDSYDGPRPVLEVWDEQNDMFAYYDC